jgi:hypothetical protein
MDPCEKCPAPARVIVAKGGPDGPDLKWCAHHYREVELELISHGWEILSDSRNELLAT